ncbi:MAG: TM2 domain-containing protein [Prevotellaceae bacterium]|jgi:TM2 domain-containing membrane protein YozV|nr:TM2 domain-containing protein [Prevotellaceae bacterium]
MFCPNCGNEISEKAIICVKCGVGLKHMVEYDNRKDWLTTLLLCIFIGGLGIHRFYTKSTGIGIIQLLTLGGCGIWWLIDLILIVSGSYRDGYGQPLASKN